MRPEPVFVLRFWLQSDGGSDDRKWRGSIHEVDSGKRYYVADIHDVVDFIDARLDEAAVKAMMR